MTPNRHLPRFKNWRNPGFLADYLQALAGIPLKQGDAVLNLGVNRGDEFIPFESEETAENKLNLNLNFTGIDISQSALMEARKRFPGERFRFICADINQLPALELGRFKLIVAIGTLHSPGVDRKLIVTLIKKPPGCEWSVSFSAFPMRVIWTAKSATGPA